MDPNPPLIQAMECIQNGNLARLSPILDEHPTLLEKSLPVLIMESIRHDKSKIFCNIAQKIKNPDFTIIAGLAIMYRSTAIITSIVSNKAWCKEVESKEELLKLARNFSEDVSTTQHKKKSTDIVELLQPFAGNKAKL